MKELKQDILMFSKLSAQKDAFVKTDIGILIEEVLEDINHTVKEKQANIELEKFPQLYVNPGLIKPLFFNLISNALKYAKQNTPPHIRIYPDDLNKTDLSNSSAVKYCRIYISDNGIGFDQQYADQIFEMFKRLHSPTEYEGTGIGLALCKQIVEKHKGYINVLSKVDEGSTFIVSLPFSQQVKPGNLS